MKQYFNIQTLIACLCCILVALSFNSCLSDGDETISLEFGNPKKILVGQWIITNIGSKGGSSSGQAPKGWKPGTKIHFYDDGTYTDSGDGGNKHHPWIVRGSEPVWRGITLDGDDFDFVYWGDGGGEISYKDPSGPTWIVGFNPTNENDNISEEETEPEEIWEDNLMVTNVTISFFDSNDNLIDKDTYSMEYYDDGRIKTYSRNNDAVSGSVWKSYCYMYKYSYTSNSVTIKKEGIYYDTSNSSVTLPLNNNGYVSKYVKYDEEGFACSVYTIDNEYLDVKPGVQWGKTYRPTDFSNFKYIDMNCFIYGDYGCIYIPELGDLAYSDEILSSFGLAGKIYGLILKEDGLGIKGHDKKWRPFEGKFDYEFISEGNTMTVKYNYYHGGEIYQKKIISYEYEKMKILQN